MRFPFGSRNPPRGLWRRDLSFSQEALKPPIDSKPYAHSIREESMGSLSGLLRPGEKPPTSAIMKFITWVRAHHIA